MFNSLKEKLKGWLKKTEPSKADHYKETDTNKNHENGKKSKFKSNKENTKKTPEKTKREQIFENIKAQEPSKVEESKRSFSLFKKSLTEEKFNELFKELEIILLQNNVAFEPVEKLKSELKTELIGSDIAKINVQEKLKQSLDKILIQSNNLIKEIKNILSVKKPVVITFLGINGSGKTTSIAKLAYLLKNNEISCCLAAADTFRAASIEQIQKHSENLKIPLIKKEYGTDPASVGFEAVQYAKKHHIDVVLIDTAGRMNTKDSLMKELEKITRVAKSDINIFVAESITGNDAIEQARAFNQTVNLTGIILSKADADEKGGTAVSIGFITKKPILFLGTGQSYGDLEMFDKKKIIQRLGL